MVNHRFIKFTRVLKSYMNSTELNGSYAIYEITDSTLVLAQVLTSSGDWVKLFQFTNSNEKYERREELGRNQFFRQRNQYLKEGNIVEYHPNGSVSATGFMKLVRIGMSKEEMFEKNRNYRDSSIYVFNPLPVGDWISYYPDGKVASIKHYNDSGKYVGTWIKYFHNGKLDEVEYKSQNGYRDKYEYGLDWSLFHIERHPKSGSYFYIIGGADSIGLSQINFFYRKRTGSRVDEKILIRNLSAHTVQLRVPSHGKLGLAQSDLLIKPNDSLWADLKFNIPRGDSNESILITTDKWEYKLKVHSFGYDLCAADFEVRDKSFFLPTKFQYYMMNEEYQLEIEKVNSTEKKRTIPFSQQLSEIELRKGIYNLTLWGSFGKRTKTVEIR